MKKLDQHLLANEKIIYRCHLHWVIFLLPLFLLAVSVVFLLQTQLLFLWVGAGLSVITLLVTLLALAKFSSTEYLLTNKRIYCISGFLQRQSWEKFLEKVDAVQIKQGLFGRMLGYGNLLILTNANVDHCFTRIAEPTKFRDRMQAQVEAN